MPLAKNWGFSNRKSESRRVNPYWANPYLVPYTKTMSSYGHLYIDLTKARDGFGAIICASSQLCIPLTFGQFSESSLPRAGVFNFLSNLATVTSPQQNPTKMDSNAHFKRYSTKKRHLKNKQGLAIKKRYRQIMIRWAKLVLCLQKQRIHQSEQIIIGGPITSWLSFSTLIRFS